MKQQLVLVVSVFFVLLLGVFGYTNFRDRNKTAQVEIQIAPGDAKITLDNASVSAGLSKVTPGTHGITIMRKGFETQTKSITVQKGDKQYIGIALASNTPETSDWYDKHPKDQKLAEAISSRNFDKTGSETATKFPIVNSLPFVGPGFSYKIDYGSITKDNKQILVISANSQAAKDDALTWLTDRGANLQDYSIQYQAL